MNLLAALLVTLVLVEGVLVGGAEIIRTPSWGPALLLVAAVAMVPLFVFCLFVLLTRFRTEMQADDRYERYLHESLSRSREVDRVLEQQGLDLLALAVGRSLHSVSPGAVGPLLELTRKLEQVVSRLDQTETRPLPAAPADALLSLGRSLMAQRSWERAAEYLDAYAGHRPDDWAAQLSRGVAHANARGTNSNVAALRAYSEALAWAPPGADPRWRGRAAVNRAAIFRRLSRLPEARADLALATELPQHPDVHEDILYNRACLHGLEHERVQTIAAVAAIRDRSRLEAIRGHLTDIFAWLSDDAEFRAALGAGLAGADTAPHSDWDDTEGGSDA